MRPQNPDKKTTVSVFLPICEKTLADVYLLMSWVTVSVPSAPQPLAWTVRSAIRSRFWCASFSIS